MRILLTSDTHIGLTKPKALEKMFAKAAESSTQPLDVIVHAGDYCGGKCGYRSVRTTVKLIRKYFPTTPYLSVLGNHDYWGARTEKELSRNMQKISDCFEEYKVWFLDDHGYLEMDNVLIFGDSGWYYNSDVDRYANDRNYMPNLLYGQPLHEGMARQSFTSTKKTLVCDDFVPEKGRKKIWVSHFPVINPDPLWGGNPRIGDELRDRGFTHFLEGHSHRFLNGPEVFNCGGHYGAPKYLIIDI